MRCAGTVLGLPGAHLVCFQQPRLSFYPGKFSSLFFQALCKSSFSWAGEMAQWLRALVAFAENLDSVPSTYKAAHNHLEGSSGESGALFWLPQVLHAYGAQTKRHRGSTHTHGLKINQSHKRLLFHNYCGCQKRVSLHSEIIRTQNPENLEPLEFAVASYRKCLSENGANRGASRRPRSWEGKVGQ